MKKIIMAALVLTALTASAFSTKPADIGRQVLNTFNKSYSNAQNVKWELVSNYIKVDFTVDGQQMFAYYREDGDQIAITRNISSTQLPLNLSAELRRKLDKQWITELFELSANGETDYFATLESADQITVLKTDASGSWTIFRKTRKAE